LPKWQAAGRGEECANCVPMFIIAECGVKPKGIQPSWWTKVSIGSRVLSVKSRGRGAKSMRSALGA